MTANLDKPAMPQESVRLAVDAMMAEWDEWAAENQGTRECFEASLRAALSQLQPSPNPNLSALYSPGGAE